MAPPTFFSVFSLRETKECGTLALLPVRVTVPFFTPTGETEAMADVPEMPVGFGPRLQQERERHGWSLQELAHRSGVPRSQLSRFESGLRTNPTRDTLERLSESLGVTIDYLVGRSHTRQETGPGGEDMHGVLDPPSDHNR